MPAGRARRPALSLLAAVLVAAGCGDDTGAPVEEVSGVGAQVGGSSASLAQCRDWERGSVAERFATVEDIRVSLTPQSAEPGAEPSLSDEEAYDLFERTCAQDFAVAFRLYKVYAQAQAFAPLRPPGE
jgi:hypothetical protein